MTNRPIVHAVLRLLGTQGIGPVRARGVMRWCRQAGVSLDEFTRNPHAVGGVLRADLAARLRATPDMGALVDQLEATKVEIFLDTDEEYPSSLARVLGDKTPPLVMVRGNPDVLRKPSVGFCGSRKATEKGIATAQDCAGQLAGRGVNVTSGYAAGVDLAAHAAALQAGGTTTVVLAEGILGFQVKQELAGVWDWQRTAVVSEFLPMAPWNVGHAMQRNATICGLSQAMILIEARSTGGSAEAGRTCVKLGLPLFATVFEEGSASTSGNRDLIREGAQELFRGKATGRAKLDNVFAAIAKGAAEPRTASPATVTASVPKTACMF